MGEEAAGDGLDLGPVCGSERTGERAVSPDLRRQPVGSRARVVIEADRRLLPRRDPRIRLPVLALADQPEDDERDRDHRHDDDEHEEQPQSGAEAGQAITQIADEATVRHLPRRSVPTGRVMVRMASTTVRCARRLQSAIHPGL